MSRGDKEKRRIVSKGKYAAILSEAATFSFAGGVISALGELIALFSCLGMLVSLLLLVWEIIHPSGKIVNCLAMLLVSLLLCGVGVFVTWCGKRAISKADRMESVEPLTRRSVAELPPEETLLRASSDASSPDELLRPASYGQETPAEELLRPGQSERG